MIRIRRDQMEALQQSAKETFCDQLVAHLRRIFAQQLALRSDSDLRKLTRLGVDHAMGLGLTAKGDVRRYLEASVAQSWICGRQSPSATAILERSDLTPSEKMDYVERLAESCQTVESLSASE
jgi:hypothetical protein